MKKSIIIIVAIIMAMVAIIATMSVISKNQSEWTEVTITEKVNTNIDPIVWSYRTKEGYSFLSNNNYSIGEIIKVKINKDNEAIKSRSLNKKEKMMAATIILNTITAYYNAMKGMTYENKIKTSKIALEVYNNYLIAYPGELPCSLGTALQGALILDTFRMYAEN